ncbi:MAG: hypothetical protein AMQ22_00588 [Candidatus Methanofastidiosum methylothiophilum]|uniref:Uncharacterized protein n=1 Tax=Candidatus Methanofastidiosum methylothiophilum TaxID=1705564 RepID=A0A150J6E2_9EURY|nr:MAG: hypothetical protein AMQ22_00588 [Candidatus Methanofastidiosum methylthiophilus]
MDVNTCPSCGESHCYNVEGYDAVDKTLIEECVCLHCKAIFENVYELKSQRILERL